MRRPPPPVSVDLLLFFVRPPLFMCAVAFFSLHFVPSVVFNRTNDTDGVFYWDRKVTGETDAELL